jgi:hypothetical protein
VGTADFVVVVHDTTAPVVTVPADIPAVEPSGASGAGVTFGPATADDLVDGTVATDCDPASGSVFPLGVTTVECRATDAHGNEGQARFTITVQDRTAPTVTPPADVTAEAGSAAGAVVGLSGGSALDLVGGTLPLDCLPASGTLFPIGDTHRHLHRDRRRGEHRVGRLPRARRRPRRLRRSAAARPDGRGELPRRGAVASFPLPSATDAVDADVTVVCTPASGDVFRWATRR